MIKSWKRIGLFYFISISLTFLLLAICIKLSNASTPEDIKTGMVVSFVTILTCIVFFPFILLPIPQKDIAKFIKMIELFKPKTKHDDNKVKLNYTEKTEDGYTSLKIRTDITFSKRFQPEVYIHIERNGETVFNNTVYYVNSRTLNMEYLWKEEKAWLKWYLKHYLDFFYEQSISEKANQLLKG